MYEISKKRSSLTAKPIGIRIRKNTHKDSAKLQDRSNKRVIRSSNHSPTPKSSMRATPDQEEPFKRTTMILLKAPE